MKRISISVLAVGTAGCVLASTPLTPGRANDDGSPIFGVTIPDGYRQWELIAPSEETGVLDELRAILGNDLSVKAYREGTLPFPDGAILVKLAWRHSRSAEFGPAFVPGPATTVQIMVKDSKKFALDRRLGVWPIYRRQAGG